MDREIIQKGFELLKREKYYDQVTIVRKLKYLSYSVAEATFSNILRGKKVRETTLDLASRGLRELVEAELGLFWNGKGFVKRENPEWTPLVIKESTPAELALALKPDFVFHAEGRLAIHKKVAFFESAQREVIEMGVTLNTFSSYFFSRNDREFKIPVERLLEKGVRYKCYLLDPASNEARIYFEDRNREQGDEIRKIETIQESIRRLERIKQEFDEAGHPGTFEIFTYKHIPYNYFMAVDGATPNGKIMASHYLYGIPRAKCPVVEFSKSESHELFRLYWNSLQKLTKGAKSLPR